MPPDIAPPPHAGLPPAFSPAPTPERPLAGVVVLAVEDSRFACEALRLMCLRLGARLRRADSIAAAGVHLARYRPDVVLVDLGLPDGRGSDLIARLAREPDYARPAILCHSAEDGAEDVGRAAGATGFLPKPLPGLAAVRAALVAQLPGRSWLFGGTADVALPPPDTLALRDDLMHAARHHAAAPGDEAAPYLRGFVAGLARVSGDAALAAAAQGARPDLTRALADRIARIDATLRGIAAT